MLTERQLFLLKLLVNDYIKSAEPIGSRAISKRDDVQFSSATIRNELADMEELGYLEKPHSSSGRVPSEKGYRYYVDHLLSPAMLSKQEMVDIKKAFREQYYELEKLIQGTADILSDFTNYTSIVLGPEVLETKLKHIQMISLSAETSVLIIITNTGHVENRTVSLPKGIQPQEIEKLVNILNVRLKGTPLYKIKFAIDREIKDVLRQHLSQYQLAIKMLNEALSYHPLDQIYYGGKTNMLAQPEFKDIDKVLPLLNALERKDIVYDLLKPIGDSRIHIKIGQENDFNEIKNCSVLTASYSIGGEHLGTVAVIGPTRMTYPKVVTLLDIVSRSLSKSLTERYQGY
ncbi:heat-inducible transcriptional repressor [Pullulanibacillus pueri]|uniref:Heat-inducible transcription repressor HrcA n=1 Tax=Pullulanibacillus pueri TaxID=1437324 RepID=A0A8J2ZYN8_9BACL|nr:heat-inducible transcriptional repressor HrcA [Pullulanibacillus pueri]MBM7683061.1 heat-inducible transcriptional repressor [Pullulanibacillus pueri]GGH84925.1 heat-inducible transcription repressor HrcA [Pullulanibacillus pueri]